MLLNEQELNRKLAEWAGFKFSVRGYTFPPGADTYPWNAYWKDGQRTPNFTQSFDACLKWLVPLLWICHIELLDGIFWSVEVSIPDLRGSGEHGSGKALDENLALALCLAISILIDGEQNAVS